MKLKGDYLVVGRRSIDLRLKSEAELRRLAAIYPGAIYADDDRPTDNANAVRDDEGPQDGPSGGGESLGVQRPD